MPNLDCLVVWPATATDGDLLPPYARPEHRCMLPAGHIHERITVEERVYAEPGRLGFEERSYSVAPPHECHCGASLTVRDVEVAK
jgi:hypothetical protein